MIPAWQERYKILQKQGADLLTRYQGLIKPQGTEAATISKPIDTVIQGTLTQSVAGVVTGKIDPVSKRIEYTLERVGKLKQPWSGGLLRDYAYHKARDAFDHDLTRTVDEEK